MLECASKLKACNNLKEASDKGIDPILSLNSFYDDFTMIKNTTNVGISLVSSANSISSCVIFFKSVEGPRQLAQLDLRGVGIHTPTFRVYMVILSSFFQFCVFCLPLLFQII